MKTTIHIFEVTYTDDFGRRHLTIARDMDELRYIQNRFERVESIVYQKDI